MQRRDFLTAAATTGALSTLSATGGAPRPAEASAPVPAATGDRRTGARLRIGSQVRAWIPGQTDVEKLAQMKAWGMEAVEYHGNVVDQPREFKKKADDAGLKVSVICWGACNGEPCSADPEESRQGIDKLKRALEAAAVLECNGVIYVPAFNKHQQRINRTHQEIRKALIDIDPNTKEIQGGFLKEVGDFAASMQVNVILEPLNRKEAWFLRQVADAASICRDCQSEGVKTMGDFYHMFYEEPDDMGAFLSGGKYVKHVHLACGNRRVMPGQDPAQSFLDGFRGLKYIGYDQYMCFECRCDGDGAVEVPKVLDFLKQSWDEA